VLEKRRFAATGLGWQGKKALFLTQEAEKEERWGNGQSGKKRLAALAFGILKEKRRPIFSRPVDRRAHSNSVGLGKRPNTR